MVVVRLPILTRKQKKKTINLMFGVISFGAIRSDLYHSFGFASQTDRAPRQLAPIIVVPFLTFATTIHNLATSVLVLFYASTGL